MALAGLGGHGQTIQRAVEATTALEVVAVFDPVDAEALAASERFGCAVAASYEALLARDDLDAIGLASPNHVHRAQTEAALAAGLDVFVEKPIANTVADGRAMVAAAEAAGQVLMVGHNMRYGPAFRAAHDLLASGRLGEVVSVEVHFSLDSGLRLAPDSWRLRPDQAPLLPMMQLGIHGVDVVHYLLGPVRRVYAHARSVAIAPPVVDSVTATFTLDDGVHGTIVSNYCTPVRFSLNLAGTEGLLDSTPHTVAFTPRTDAVDAEAHDFSDDPYASYVAQMGAFAEAVRTRRPPETDGRAGLQALAVIEAMQASIEADAPVALPTLSALTSTPVSHAE
jgi:predicted dehydrogenase